MPENYYLDNNDNIYKKCFNTCKKCNKFGNELNNNCQECIDDYKFINDSLAIPNNCYSICPFSYYYFDDNNKYHCVISCPSLYSKIIEPKKKCIDDCKKDNEYLFDFNNHCFKECPENLKIYFEEKKCLESCYPNQTEYKGICYNNLTNITSEPSENGQILFNNDTNFDDFIKSVLLK